MQRGLTLSAAAIAGAVSANSVQAAPAGLAATLSAVALTKGATAGGSTATLVKGTLKLMAWTKAKMAIVVGLGVLLAAGTTTVVVEKVMPPAVDESFWAATLENLDRAPAVVLIRPARYFDHTAATADDGRMIAHNMSFIALLEAAYSLKPIRMTLPSHWTPRTGAAPRTSKCAGSKPPRKAWPAPGWNWCPRTCPLRCWRWTR